MDIEIVKTDTDLPVERAYVITMIIRSFKGRKDVEVHLFRSTWNEEELDSMDWSTVLADSETPENMEDLLKSKKFLMEAFTAQERDAALTYLKSHYQDRVSRVTSMPLNFPLPPGLMPLGSVPLGSDIGIIDFTRIPHFDLDVAMAGLYDLSQHKPLVEMSEES